jgi:RNA polymerase sigma factor (TIGR02999 family)
MSDLTQILSNIENGDPTASDQLLPLVYDELRRLAAARLSHERPGQTLQATALVHEAYMRLVGKDERQHWNGRRHFFGAAAEAMRRILIDNARRRKQPRHGGDRHRLQLDEGDAVVAASEELLALDEALTIFEQRDPQAAELVKLRYFAGLTMQQAAESLGLSLRTAERNWTYARTWLHAALADDADESRVVRSPKK